MIAQMSQEQQSGKHIPVLLDEVIAALKPAEGELYIDGTFGAGGYTRAVLDAAGCKVVAIDRDPGAVARADAFRKEYGDRFDIREGCFGAMDTLVSEIDIRAVDGVVLDIGVSSFQLDEAVRGFSFREDGPLDMRMSSTGESAADVVNTYDESELADIIYQYGEERKSRRIASAIVKRREEAAFERTLDLANLIEAVLGRAPVQKGRKAVHPATRTFQALRIHVNDELGELRRGLTAAEAILKPGGRLVVVSFHSLEDRIVKSFMAERSGRVPSASRHMPVAVGAGPSASFSMQSSKVVKPSRAEEQANPRARSARLRVAVRTDAAAWDENLLGGDHA